MKVENTEKVYQGPIIPGGLMPMNLQLFAGDVNDKGGDSADGADDKGAPKDSGGADDDKKDDKKGKPGESDETFTQEDVNNITSRESKKTQEKLLKELGIEDFKDAKEGMKKFREWQDAQKTDAQKKDEKLENLEKDHATIKSENQTLKAQISAVKAGVIPDSVEDVVVLANNLVSDELDIDQAIQAVIEKYPHFAKEVEEDEDDDKPRFSRGEHSKKSADLSDPFKAKMAKYK